jgi:predicted glycosyltransferase
MRILYYCHDTYGLGHITRSVTLATYVAARRPDAAQLIVTGSPLAHAMALPARTDYIKLPSVTKTGREAYASRTLPVDFETVRQMREDLIGVAVERFQPDLLLVDHAPAGMAREIVPALMAARGDRHGPRLVLGLRDVVDEPESARSEWQSAGAFELMDSVYDRIWVYGQRDIFDIAAAYRLSGRAAAKLRYVGYLRRESAGGVTAEASDRPDGLAQVVVTAGGGADGFALMRRYAHDLAAAYPDGRPPFRSLLVTGPFMPESEAEALAQITARAVERGRLKLARFVPALAHRVATADVVVSMAGYNTTCEILSFGRPAVMVPRVRPRQEQLLRASALSRRGLVDMLHPDALAPGRLLDRVERALARPHRPHRPISLDGLPNVLGEMESLMQPDVAAAGAAAWPGRLL